MLILSINAGSSTLKFAVHVIEHDMAQAAALKGSIEGLEPGGNLSLSWQSGGQIHREQPDVGSDADPFEAALQMLERLVQQQCAGRELQAIAHRVVHGGESFRQAVKVDPAILQTLSDLSPLAPLHQPHNIDGIVALGRAFPNLPQIACFDTAFHADLPEEEYLFALPQALRQQGIRRYGFHGLSYQSVSQTFARFSPRANGRVVMAHLGNGASLCGMLAGKSRATTMGFSALDGLIMGTRCGEIDAGVILHLLSLGWDHARLQDLLYRQSGLLGISGLSADMRRLRASDDPNAQLAIRMFGYRIVRETAAMAACLGGMDALVFTGGIGEHDTLLRAEVCDRLAFLGVALDHEANSRADGSHVMSIHAASSQTEVWVVPTDEARMAAQAAADLIRRENFRNAVD